MSPPALFTHYAAPCTLYYWIILIDSLKLQLEMIVITLDTAGHFRKAKFNHTFIHPLLHVFGLQEDVRVPGENIQGSRQEPSGCDASVLTTDHYTTVPKKKKKRAVKLMVRSTNYSTCLKNAVE